MKTALNYSLHDGLELEVVIAHSPLDSEGLDMNIMAAFELESGTRFPVLRISSKEQEEIYNKLCNQLMEPTL